MIKIIDEELEKKLDELMEEYSKLSADEIKQIEKEINEDMVKYAKVACEDFIITYDYILDGILYYLELYDTEVSIETIHSFFFGIDSILDLKNFHALFINTLLKDNKIDIINNNQIKIKY